MKSPMTSMFSPQVLDLDGFFLGRCAAVGPPGHPRLRGFGMIWGVGNLHIGKILGHTYIHTYIRTYVHTYIHTYRHTHTHRDRQTDRQTERQTDRQTYIHIMP